MQRNSNASGRVPAGATQDVSPARQANSSRHSVDKFGTFWDLLAFRAVFIAVCGAAGWHFRPFGLSPIYASSAGLIFSIAIIAFEIRLRRVSLRRLIGAATGSILGILGAYLTSLIFTHTTMPESTRSFFSLAVFIVMAYVGLVLGANKGDMLNLQAFGGIFGSERSAKRSVKLLDTSVVIDGRVADIADALFLDGSIVIPQFVLRELQLVADSADPLKRQRGRRGLEVLHRIQKMPHLDVQIAEDDFAQVADVDMKLIEMAKRYDAKIVTNDFNLNKVATLQGIEIMNVNQLANALKPVVLPGEAMRVFILREGKEFNQGVAYLDDGTMVVVDGARKMINKTIDINVTSVHQTTAGKMIFGRYDERSEQAARAATSPAGAGGDAPGGGSPRTAESGMGGERPPRPLYPEPGRS
ncbi:MAG TPA: PIN domain-containing protein [Candidatus Acidoferrales bacterium]|nr:PIN domain-containing protein [Candidatus Acidoferrales bacterium]